MAWDLAQEQQRYVKMTNPQVLEQVFWICFCADNPPSAIY